ncbi:hypothetical protein K502DRAFT_349227 [Neoconidiobolus thromboides FSU 785]|nr:hypothetical protein K502DRAFT_349227 [Neoconidiobolus thromboides FSU 785]
MNSRIAGTNRAVRNTAQKVANILSKNIPERRQLTPCNPSYGPVTLNICERINSNTKPGPNEDLILVINRMQSNEGIIYISGSNRKKPEKYYSTPIACVPPMEKKNFANNEELAKEFNRLHWAYRVI